MVSVCVWRLAVLYLSYSLVSFITFAKEQLDYLFQSPFVPLAKAAHQLQIWTDFNGTVYELI